MHNYVGREGAAPGDLLAAGRAEVAGYGGDVVSGTVASAEPIDARQTGEGFRVLLDGGRTVLALTLMTRRGLRTRRGPRRTSWPRRPGWSAAAAADR